MVESKIGVLNVQARVDAYDGGSRTVLTDVGFDDAIDFVTLTSLSANTSARVSGAHASSFLALDARAAWASPDHGTATLNSLSSVFYDGSSFVAGGKVSYTANAEPGALPPFGSGRPTPFWQYNFTPNVDAYFSIDVSKVSTYPTVIEGAHQFDGDFYLLIDDVLRTDSLADGATRSFFLEAGRNYTVSLDPYLRELYTANTQEIADNAFGAFTLTFDITAAAGPPPAGGALPEPGAGLLMVSGFAVVGSALRASPVRRARRRRPMPQGPR